MPTVHGWYSVLFQGMNDEQYGIAITYCYTYASYYLGDIPFYIEIMMRNLFHQAVQFLRSQNDMRWSLPTLPFTFSAKTLATTDRENDRKDLCLSEMEFAMEILETGDRECRTRALMLGREPLQGGWASGMCKRKQLSKRNV